MCNSSNCTHNDNLNDDLLDIFGTGLSDDGKTADTTLSRVEQYKMHEERCKACNGSGQFRGYTGRILGECFKCKGKGVLFFRQSIEQREKATKQRNARKLRDAATKADQANEWLEANPAEAAWLKSASERGFEFAQSLLQALYKYGHFTEKQEAAVRSATAKTKARREERRVEAALREAKAQVIDIRRIEEAFAAAKSNGLKWPKLRLDVFVFSPAGENSKNAGAIYVKEGEIYLGKIASSRFVPSRECSSEAEERILYAASHPAEAAVAYGRMTGSCSCCGRELTNEESVALGIGPICRGKYGWA